MIKDLIKKELARQKKVINLIPSENYPSKDVLRALGSQLTSKYAEGKSHQRYYFGNKVVDEIEDEVSNLVYKVFKISPKNWGVNVQPYSGSIANLAVYLGVLDLGDRVLAMSLEQGGHLSHGHKVNWTGKFFEFQHYGVGRDGFINYEEILVIAQKFKPKLIVCGATAYPRIIDFKRFREIADSVPSTGSGRAGALMMADISHIAGLIAGGVHPSPFPYADVVTTTTQKTLRGPRGAMIISRKDLSDKIDKAIFPGLQGGPHLNVLGAMGVALEEALKPSFKNYAEQVVKNAKVLAEELKSLGFKIVTGGTDNHLILVDVAPLGLTGKQAGEKLEEAGVIVNKNMIPFDQRKPWDPSGIRLGTPAVTTRGAKEKEMIRIAKTISQILK
ncbi:MAG: glycine hydroxymethyltransferase [Parcubacteria group bacterium Gr01-1014_2]|nr:MAG: glycine hydroxymethyltransferase [Parcubacteria group bacterium Gr01-1014_2]